MKQVATNYKGQLTFIENKPFDAFDTYGSNAIKIILEKVPIEFRNNEIIFQLKLLPSFFNNIYVSNEHLNEDIPVRFKFDNDWVKYIFNGYGIQVSCDLFKTSLTFELLGDLYPSSECGMAGLRNFHVSGAFL